MSLLGGYSYLEVFAEESGCDLKRRSIIKRTKGFKVGAKKLIKVEITQGEFLLLPRKTQSRILKKRYKDRDQSLELETWLESLGYEEDP